MGNKAHIKMTRLSSIAANVRMNQPVCIVAKFVKQPKQFTQVMMKVMKGLNYGAGAMIARQTHFIK